MNTSCIRISSLGSTVLWEGDVAVLGGSYAGVEAAALAARLGRRTCVLEPGMTLGTELTQQWNTSAPPPRIAERLAALCRELGIPETGRPDIFAGTLAFDRMVTEMGASSIVRVRAMRPLATDEGLLRGVEVVGRSGRQAVLAPMVLDALPGRPFARGVAGLAAPGIGSVRRRVYLTGVDVAEPARWRIDESLGIVGNQVRVTPASWAGEAVLHVEVANERGQDLGALTGRSLLLATDLVEWLRANRRECSHAGIVDISPAVEPIFLGGDADWSALAGTGIAAVPEDQDGSASVLESNLRSPSAARRPLPPASEPAATECLVTSELAAAPEQDLAETVLPETTAILHDPVDVLVAGYGTGGAVAALTAASEHLEVAVLDPAPVPGGIGTAGRIHSYYHGLQGGLQDHIDENMAGKTAAISEGARGYHPIAKAAVLTDAMDRANLGVFTGHTVIGVVKTAQAVEGIVSAAADGYHVFPCRVAIDSTGDGDVCAAAGAPMVLGREGDGFPQPYSYTPSLMREGVLHHSNFDAGWVDPTDTLDFSRAHFEGREKLWDLAPFSQEKHFCTLASVLGIRESRFLKGNPSVTFADFMEGRSYPDSVCSASAHYDNHAMDYAEESEWGRRHVVMFGLWRYLCHGHIPYRAFLPLGVDGVLMACRALAVDHDLHQLVRMQRDIQVFGEICGVAAAMAVREGIAPAAIDVSELQQTLRSRGIEPKPAEPVMDKPVTELLKHLQDDDQTRGLAMWRLSTKTGTEGAFWTAFFEQETDDDARFAGAVAAAMGGHDLEPVRKVLLDTVEHRIDGPRLGTKSPPRTVVACLALSALDVPGLSRTVGDLLGEQTLEAPDLLLLLRSLAESSDSAAATREINAFLDATQGNHFTIPLWGVAAGSPTSFRPAIELRAAKTLARLGGKADGLQLEPYMVHDMLLIRRQARRIAHEAGT